jgi:hypothetical protein
MMKSMDKQEATATNDAHHTLRTIRFLSLTLIGLGLLFWLYMTAFIFGYYDQPRRLIEVVALLIPYLYLFAFFLSCLRIVRGRLLVGLCVIFNLPLVLLIGYALINLSFTGIVLSIFPMMWILLCTERLKVEGATPSNNSLNQASR